MIRFGLIALMIAAVSTAFGVEPGERAPELKAVDVEGRTVGLGELLRGEGGAVLVWFAQPESKAAAELVRSIEEERAAIEALGVSVLLVSVDSAEAIRPLSATVNHRVRIAGDPSRESAERYGVLHPSGLFARRTTVFIGPDGTVQLVDRRGETSGQGRAILKLLETLRGDPAGAPGDGGE